MAEAPAQAGESGGQGESGPPREGLDLEHVKDIALRTLPYVRPVLRELRPLVWLLPFVLLAIPIGMLLTDLFVNRLLGGQPLTEFEAWLLRVDPEEFVAVEALSVEAREFLRGRMLRDAIIVVVVGIPIALWVVNLFIRLRQTINQVLRVQMMERLHAMSPRFHSDSRVGDAVYRTFQDSAMVTNLVEMLVRPIGPLWGMLIGFIVSAVFDWRLPIALLALYGVCYWLARRYTGPFRDDFRLARERNSALTSRIQETLVGAKVIKAYGAEAREQVRFEEASRNAFAGAFQARSRFALFGVLTYTVCAIPPMVGAAYLAVWARDGRPLLFGFAVAWLGFALWNVGSYTNALQRLNGGTRGIRRILHMWAQTQDMVVGMERAFSQVDLVPEIEDAPDARELDGLASSVAFRGVHFRYQPERPILEDVSLVARAGTVTALVGPTGSGKSTLVSLLLRLYDPDEGGVEIDGVDLRAFYVESVRRNVAVALQENLLFGTTIRENIRYAVPDASDEQVRDAARVACAEEFILRQPEGYETRLGERGSKLSTGQRQRLSIARAVIKDTPILVLDEPTASLDAETELRVMQNLAEWGRGRAIFLVTHRLSTIRRADQIAYLRDGRLVECGSHAELLEREGGAYRRFVELERGDAAASAPPQREIA